MRSSTRWLLAAIAVVLLTMALLRDVRLSPVVAQTATNCGLAAPALCETFDAPSASTSRSGQLDSTLWGVSRLAPSVPQQQLNDPWFRATSNHCGNNPEPLDVEICNGQLVESVNDGASQPTLAIYPKQPFDIAGRTGKVAFDLSANPTGPHGAWPGFAYTDQPVPAPGFHQSGMSSDARNGFGFNFLSECDPGTGNNTGVGVDNVWVVSNGNYQGLTATKTGCIAKGSPSALNHFEIDLNASGATVYGTAPGGGPLVQLATIAVSMPLSRGLIWIEDQHYNASKDSNPRDQEFVWDNVGFDGPFLPRDLTYDVLDGAWAWDSEITILGWRQATGSGANSTTAQTNGPLPLVPNVVNPGAASGALLTFNYSTQGVADTFIYSLNGKSPHTCQGSVDPEQQTAMRNIACTVPLSDVVAGQNTVMLDAGDYNTSIANIDLVLQGAGGTVPCQCNGGTPVPPSTATTSPTLTPSPSATAVATASPSATSIATATTSPTSTPTASHTSVPPTATPTSTPSPVLCEAVVRVDGQYPEFKTVNSSFCTGAHP